MGVEFTCERCGGYIFNSTLAYPPPDGKCFRCGFLDASFPDPVERREVSDYLDRDLSDD